VSRTIKAESDKIKSRGGDRVKKTGEVFTPLDLCIKMIKQIPQHILEDPESTFLDNSCGDGNFLVALTKVLGKYHDKKHIVDNMLYGVDLIPDNIAQVKHRLGVDKDHPNFVCADALTYDYTFDG
jgi:ubiquinone/menaquinone biosynthesis C-methylase UbiE